MNKKPANSNPTKEFFTLLKTIEKNTKNQARISSYNPDDISSFMVEICPIKGSYQHAKFLFQIQLTLYPREFPNVICLSDIYHPNIEHGEDYHNVCLNLFDNWNRTFGLIDVIQGLIFLLYQPNLSDPISSFFNSKNTNEEIFRKNVYTSLHGGIVDGIEFLPNPGIIEYNESVKRKNVVEQKVIVVEKKEDERSEVVQLLDIDYIPEEMKKDINEVFDDSDNEEQITTIMRNNNAAQMGIIECIDEDVKEDDCGLFQSEVDEEIDENLPTRDIVSPNAFYSDLICSRYAPPDKFSESEIDSELCNAFDSYYGDTDYDDEDDDVDDDSDDDDDDIQFARDDNYISLPSNGKDPSTIFLSKWLELRVHNNWSKECPAPMTCIILTNVLNPFRHMIGTFVLCNVQNYNNWRFSEQCVYRIDKHDNPLQLMVWMHNLCHWSMRRQRLLSIPDYYSRDRSLCYSLSYSLLLGLSLSIRARINSLYGYCDNGLVCHYIK